ATVENLAHSASFHCWPNNAPSNPGTKHLSSTTCRATGRPPAIRYATTNEPDAPPAAAGGALAQQVLAGRILGEEPQAEHQHHGADRNRPAEPPEHRVLRRFDLMRLQPRERRAGAALRQYREDPASQDEQRGNGPRQPARLHLVEQHVK